MEEVVLGIGIVLIVYVLWCSDSDVLEGFHGGYHGLGYHNRFHGGYRNRFHHNRWAGNPYMMYSYPFYNLNDYVYDYPEDYEIVFDRYGNKRLIRRKIKYY